MAVDGQPVEALPVSQVSFAIGQRANTRVSLPKEGGVFPVLALREGAPERTGVILATAGVIVQRLADVGDMAGPVLDPGLERQLRPLKPLASKEADRSFMTHLSGTMDGYSWAMGARPG